MAEGESLAAGYPPPRHFMRDLRVEIEEAEGRRRLRVPLVPELLSDAETLDIGVAATLLDMLGGGAGVAAAQPDWAVTSDMNVHLARRASSGTLVGESRVLRAGRNTIVLDASIATEDDERPVATAQLGFTRVPRRPDTPRFVEGGNRRVAFAGSEHGFEAPFYEALGVRIVDAQAGALEIPVADYQRNSLRALQGGIVVAFASKAAEAFARATTGGAVVTTDLTAHYLAMSKVGPIRSAAALVRADGDGVVLRIELRDRGADDRLCVVATAVARPL